MKYRTSQRPIKFRWNWKKRNTSFIFNSDRTQTLTNTVNSQFLTAWRWRESWGYHSPTRKPPIPPAAKTTSRQTPSRRRRRDAEGRGASTRSSSTRPIPPLTTIAIAAGRRGSRSGFRRGLRRRIRSSEGWGRGRGGNGRRRSGAAKLATDGPFAYGLGRSRRRRKLLWRTIRRRFSWSGLTRWLISVVLRRRRKVPVLAPPQGHDRLLLIDYFFFFYLFNFCE